VDVIDFHTLQTSVKQFATANTLRNVMGFVSMMELQCSGTLTSL
jgi:hypothetical protein